MLQKKLTHFFKDKKFRSKIVFVSLLSSLIPLLLLSVIAFSLLQYFMIKQEENKNTEYLTAISTQLDNRLTSSEDSMNYLLNNTRLIQGLSFQTISNYNLYDLYVNDIVPLFNGIMDQHPAITQISLYTTEDIYNHGQYVRQIMPDDITQYFQRNRNITPKMYYDDATKKLYLYGQIFSHNREATNYIVFEMDYKRLFSDLKGISQDRYSIEIQDEQNRQLYQYSTLNENEKRFVVKVYSLFSKGTVSGTTRLNNDWLVRFSKSKADVYANSLILIFCSLVILLLCLGAIFFSVRLLSKTVVAPISSLVAQITAATDGSLKMTEMYDAKDEIGQLYLSYAGLITQINQLIDDVYESEIKQKKLEMLALQAQINPHFFYNSLSLINNKAIMTGNLEISEMAQLLSKFHRLSLNQGKNQTTVSMELELTMTYARIQQKMHNQSFTFTADIAEEVYQYTMIHLLIQPFIENALFHGIDHIEDDRSPLLILRAYCHEEFLIFEVFDNGAGIAEEKLQTLLTSRGNHYGIQNVHKRIQLYYGLDPAIEYASAVNEGTFVRIKLLKNLKN